ncbi:MAG: hypothetical protein PHH14_06195, partial [Candidatus Margulisbacteria bacterium]|nr:hypothetical protein [Candidatus Margulisiibacteriota bacterium]
MAKKKKVKKAKKAKKIIKGQGSRGKKIKRKAKPAKKTKRVARSKGQVARKINEKVLGKIDHYFDKISVAAIKVLAPFKVGDMLHFKGHTTDFYQRLDSMQIEHQNVLKVKKGDDVGIKVKEFVRDHDVVYRADEKAMAARPT